MASTEAFLLFLSTWIVAYSASLTAGNLKRFQFTPEDLAKLRPGAVEFLSLLRLTGALMPIVAGIVGLFRLQWYLVLFALPLTFVGAFVMNLIVNLGFPHPRYNVVYKSLFMIALSIGMCVFTFIRL